MTISVLQDKPAQQTEIATAIAKLDAWFETMRVEDPKSGLCGYGGPVAHWWQNCLLYTGPGLDWRYEGIIAGYLNLWQNTGEIRWLETAIRAGDDLVDGQLENGHYPASAFELNPASGGTPHEAACDIGLLLLAMEIKSLSTKIKKDTKGLNDIDWRLYFEAAERNLQKYFLGKLWDHEVGYLRDHPRLATFVPNKAATACEAFFLMAELSGDDRWIERYALPSLEKILQHQVQDGWKLHGAIAQNSFGFRIVDKYFPYYIARCIPALIQGYEFTQDQRYMDSALAAMDFITRWVYPDGSLPQVVYTAGEVNRYPSWIAGLGDVLRVAELLDPYGLNHDFSATNDRLLLGQDESGGFQTAIGFAAQSGGNVELLPDFRDLLHVVGWCDKAFRYLTTFIQSENAYFTSNYAINSYENLCTFFDRILVYREGLDELVITTAGEIVYRWRKSQSRAKAESSDFWFH